MRKSYPLSIPTDLLEVRQALKSVRVWEIARQFVVNPLAQFIHPNDFNHLAMRSVFMDYRI